MGKIVDLSESSSYTSSLASLLAIISCLSDRTFRAIFEMPVIKYSHNLIKVDKQQYRNPIYLAGEWHMFLNSGRCSSLADLAQYLQISRARVTQIMNLLQLSTEVIEIVSELGYPLKSPIVSERKLRPLLTLTSDQQKAQVGIILSRQSAG